MERAKDLLSLFDLYNMILIQPFNLDDLRVLIDTMFLDHMIPSLLQCL